MNAKTPALEQYARDRRRLNTRLALLMVVLIPVPAILLRARLEPQQMLATVVAVVVGTGIVIRHGGGRNTIRIGKTRVKSAHGWSQWSAEQSHSFRWSVSWSVGLWGPTSARGLRWRFL
jgi:hypothetical protein